MFDDSVENHFRVMHTISELCGDAKDEPLPVSDIQRLSSSTTFLREWADFKYEPRDVRFARDAESFDEEDVVSRINLRQLSSATIPQNEAGDTSSLELRQDYVTYVGGRVWALDWCRINFKNQSYKVIEANESHNRSDTSNQSWQKSNHNRIDTINPEEDCY